MAESKDGEKVLSQDEMKNIKGGISAQEAQELQGLKKPKLEGLELDSVETEKLVK